MYLLQQIIALGVIALLSKASPYPQTHPQLDNPTIFHQIQEPPPGWSSQGAINNKTIIRAHIGLKQSNIEELQSKLLDISDPSSENYGKWLSAEEVNDMTAPPAYKIMAVKRWLYSHGIHNFSQSSQDWIEFTAPIYIIETLLDTKYEAYSHTSNAALVVPRTTRYSVPESLQDIIATISPTTAFYQKMEPPIQANITKRSAGNIPCRDEAVTPDCIKKLYNVDYRPKGLATASSAQLLTQQASHEDYAMFVSEYAPAAPDFRDVSISGGINDGSGDLGTLLEGNVDTQWLGAMMSPNPTDFLACSQGSAPPKFEDDLVNLASYLTSNRRAPTVVSISYAADEDDFHDGYMDRICNEFLKASARGISVIVSSGDYGAGGQHHEYCTDKFYANFPSVCPWVTSVGGTDYSTDDKEVVAVYSNDYGDGGSGGGFSKHFAAQSYQTSDTASYIQRLDGEYTGMFNARGRGYPDISIIASHMTVVVNEEELGVHGTSVAAPAFAGMIGLLNDYRLSQGKPVVGFLNTLLYGVGRDGLKDITEGYNGGCNTAGYPAMTGWDAASGLGVIDFRAFRKII